MGLAFYTDTHIPKQVAIQLRQRGITVVRCEEVAMATASDVAHLDYATEHDLCVVTKDGDFIDLHYQWLAEARPHAGVFFFPDQDVAAIGKIVSNCGDYYLMVETGAGSIDEIRNHLFIME